VLLYRVPRRPHYPRRKLRYIYIYVYIYIYIYIYVCMYTNRAQSVNVSRQWLNVTRSINKLQNTSRTHRPAAQEHAPALQLHLYFPVHCADEAPAPYAEPYIGTCYNKTHRRRPTCTRGKRSTRVFSITPFGRQW